MVLREHDAPRALAHLDGLDHFELAAVDELAHQLVRAAEERVRRRADAQALLLGPFLQIEPFLDRQDERLFRIDVLAGVEHRF